MALQKKEIQALKIKHERQQNTYNRSVKKVNDKHQEALTFGTEEIKNLEKVTLNLAARKGA